MIPTLGLRYFAMVARCGSFRTAAEQLFVAPSAVSRQISLLEADLDSPLFERGRGRTKLKLTPSGDALMSYVVKVENEARNVRSEIEALKGLRKGQVKFGAAESFSRAYLPRFLATFNTGHPGITYSVHIAPTPELIDGVMSDELDAALCINPTPTAGVTHVHESPLRTSMLVPQGHPFAAKESVRLSDCAEFGMAWPDASITARRLLDEMFGRARVKPRIVLVSNSFEMLRNASMAGLSLAVVAEFVEPEMGSLGGYRYVPIQDANLGTYILTLSVRTGRSLSTASLAFIDAMKTELDALALRR